MRHGRYIAARSWCDWNTSSTVNFLSIRFYYGPCESVWQSSSIMMSKFYYYFLAFLAPSEFGAFAFAFFAATARCICCSAPIYTDGRCFCVDSAFSNFRFVSIRVRVDVYVCLWEWNRLHLHGKVIRLDMQDHRIQLIIQQFSIITLRLFDSQRFLLVDFIHPNRIFYWFAFMLPSTSLPKQKNEYRSPNNECGCITGGLKGIYVLIFFSPFVWQRTQR